jgi:hypothetical protein
MTKRKREPRTPMPTGLPGSFEQALEAEIVEIMSDWPDRMERALRRAGLGEGLNDPEAGHRLWQAKLEHALAHSSDPDTVPTIVYLAEQGQIAAQRTLRNHSTKLLEDGKADLPSSVRTYLVRLINGLVPSHPQDRSEVIDHLYRDVGIAVMVDAAALRWSLPKLNSSQQRHSAAYFVALVMTQHGIALTERQVRRIYQDRAKLAARMAKFLTADQTI